MKHISGLQRGLRIEIIMIEVSLKVWGDRALFTRPEFKAEQVSYDIPTPSAAEGLLDSIFWKPEITYRRLTRIEVLKPIRFSGLMINHVKSVVSRTGNPINIETDRTQRHALYLKDVAYVFTYKIKVQSGLEEGKYLSQYLRRIEKGSWFQPPYLGTKECQCYFGLPSKQEVPIDETKDMGWMLHSIDYRTGEPSFFRPMMAQGRIDVPVK